MSIALDSRWLYYPHENRVVKNGRIIIEDTKIIFSGKKTDSKAITSGHDRYNYPLGIIIPGLINAHTHLPEVLLRGLTDDRSLKQWLDYIWTYEPKMRDIDAYWGSMLGIAEMLACGTIGFNDQYFYSNQMAKAVYESGIKAVLSPSIFFDGNPEANSMDEAFKHAINTFDKWHGKNNRLWIGFGPHAPYTVNDEWFLRLADEARNRETTLHTHFHETEGEIKLSLEKVGERPIGHMEKLGVLDVIRGAAHCIYLTERERKILHKNQSCVLHCPKSNLKIGAGIANIPELIRSKVNVCLGTDGQASNNKLDMIEEIAMEVLIHKGINRDPTLTPSHEVIRMATINASQLFPKGVYSGTLDEGTSADLAVINLDSIPTTPIINPVSHLTYAIGRENVIMTIVDGEILYHEGKFPTLDSEHIKEQARNATENIIARTEK